MNKKSLRRYLQSNNSMSDKLLDELLDYFKYASFSKNTFLIEENSIMEYTFFLESGYVRAFVFDENGAEVTTSIYSTSCFVNDLTSFYKKSPSTQNYQAVTDCKCWKVKQEVIFFYFNKILEFRKFGMLLVLKNYDELNERMLGMTKDNAKTRYLKLLSKHPDIIHNVPLRIIASYLGITDTSLSRIRKEISQK